jgi:Mor family transcriptional regulator
MSLQQDQLTNLRARVVRIVREATGLHERLALPVAQSICEELARDSGGGELYVPAPDRTARDAAIRRDFRVDNHAEVMRRHGVSRATLYRVIGG